ncbi:uncharacterized protein MONBRDRAFT_28655 [Monosiga brevicollis MX1]|uniref:Anaphase-promoting complex subunit 2 n=1 Tax=Monosiga brevicollis TaxID=81824 RepID=A9V8T1_MONBE|nr:uncharacterized protein MONBRDRAFT_28655 [Monosiga brevicollis MX1]EDQ86015.1 predicted protein [Monosiga brevicollis MX1]|eukprot:XP_001749209.1 hypothetical protein [Monosiga brevicollis MX1]
MAAGWQEVAQALTAAVTPVSSNEDATVIETWALKLAQLLDPWPATQMIHVIRLIAYKMQMALLHHATAVQIQNLLHADPTNVAAALPPFDAFLQQLHAWHTFAQSLAGALTNLDTRHQLQSALMQALETTLDTVTLQRKHDLLTRLYAHDLAQCLSALAPSSCSDDDDDDDDEEDDDGDSRDDGPPRLSGADDTARRASLTAALQSHLYTALPVATRRQTALPALHTALSSVVATRIARFKGDFETNVLANVDKLIKGLVPYFETTLDCSLDVRSIQRHVYHVLGRQRIAELFDIIVDYPDSIPAIRNLRTCLEQCDLRDALVHQLSAAIQKRLLHVGAQTADIISQYISTVHVLNFLDASGGILNRVGPLIRDYLQKRTDTVKNVIEAITDENTAEPDALRDEQTVVQWLPEPWDGVSPMSKLDQVQQLMNDPIQLLISIYGDPETLLSQYRNVLAKRLLESRSFATTESVQNGSTHAHHACHSTQPPDPTTHARARPRAPARARVDSETRLLETLKVRFGEDALVNCDILIKDVNESRRVHQSFSQQPVPETPAAPLSKDQVNVLVLSRLYWPGLQTSTVNFRLPDGLEQYLEEYKTSYSRLKAGRHLELRPNEGTVELQLEAGGKQLDLVVSPLAACIINLFEQQPEWSLQALAKKLECTGPVVRSKLAYWVGLGLVRETQPDKFLLDEDHFAHHHASSITQRFDMLIRNLGLVLDLWLLIGARAAGGDGHHETHEEAAAVGDGADDPLESPQAIVVLRFVEGMLRNAASLPLERIHVMLSMFMQGDQAFNGDVKVRG